MKLVTIGFALAGAVVAALVVAIPAVLAAVVMLSNEKSIERGESNEKQL
jgi:hypothetical protein